MDFLLDWPTDRLEALYRCAKRTGFFNNPHDMIRLRDIVEQRRTAYTPLRMAAE